MAPIVVSTLIALAYLESLSYGWLDTGDMGYQNEDAFVFFVDRKKDMVNRGGEKIWCTDVEDELIAFKGVKDAAVVGIPNDVVITVESGIYGGVQAGGIDFGIGQNLMAMIGHHEQMDYYNGAGVDITYMGLGELGEDGSVNSTKMGTRCTGAGGFIDITQNAKKIVFLGTFTASGAKYEFKDGKLNILQEGKIRKMVRNVAQLSFNGPMARKKGQEVMIVTERAVFELCKEGVKLIEIAPGIDLHTQILDMMDFKPIISEELREMDASLFIPNGPFGLQLKEK